jgi:hypothetical protein
VQLCVAKLQAGSEQAGESSFPNEASRAAIARVATALENLKKHGDGWDAAFLDLLKSPNYHPVLLRQEPHEVKKLIAGLAVFICDECVELCRGIIAEEGERDANGAAGSTVSDGNPKAERLCGICMEPRETDELIFLPHAAYLCATCLDEIQTVRDKQTEIGGLAVLTQFCS